MEGETGILGKHENWGIFILRIDDQIVMKFDFLEGIHVSELLFQIPTRSFDIGGSWRGISWKNTWSGGIGMKLGGWNKQMSLIRD